MSGNISALTGAFSQHMTALPPLPTTLPATAPPMEHQPGLQGGDTQNPLISLSWPDESSSVYL